MGRVVFSPSLVRIVIFCCCLTLPPAYSQDQENPAVQQDEEASRQKILKAADQIDMIETNSEATKSSVDAMKAELAELQDENATLKQQLANLQAAFNQSEANRAKERQALLDEVADLVKSDKPPGVQKKPEETDAAADTPAQPAASGSDTPLAPPPDAGPASGGTTPDDNTATPKPRKGYYHVVQSGETLTMICLAYRQNGIKVTMAQIRKANGLTDKSVLRVGQKLFIPKPGI